MEIVEIYQRQTAYGKHPTTFNHQLRSTSRSFTIVGASSDTQQMMSGTSGDCFYITTFNNIGGFSEATNTICIEGCCEFGDFNCDISIDVLDIIGVVNCTLWDHECPCADLNGDDNINILDIVTLVNMVLEE